MGKKSMESEGMKEGREMEGKEKVKKGKEKLG